MNRDYDIDSILAEIKTKKAGGRPAQPEPRRAPPEEPERYQEGERDYEARAPRRAVSRERDDFTPQARPAPQREAEAYEGERAPQGRRAARYEEEPRRENPSQERSARGYPEDGYDGEYGFDSQPPRGQRGAARPDRYADDRYEEEPERPVKRAREPDYSEREAYPARRQPQREDYYEEERPAARKQAPSGQTGRQRTEREYDDRYEEEAPRQQKRSGRKGADDEFMEKYSSLPALGTRKPPQRIDRNLVHTHFGDAEPITPKPLKPRGSQRAAEPERPVQRPELRSGFRMEPEERPGALEDPFDDEDGMTRLNLPVSEERESFPLDEELTRDDLPIPPEQVREEEPERAPRRKDRKSSPELSEYSSQSEVNSVRADLDVLRSGLIIRFAVTLLCVLGLLYLGLAQNFEWITIPELFHPADAPLTYLIINLTLLLAATLVNHSVLSSGVVGLVTLKANNNSLAAFAVLASVMQIVALILSPDELARADVQLYCAVAALGLLFQVVGRLFVLGRVAGNFRLVASGGQKYVAQALEERELGREFTWDMNIEQPHVAYSARTSFVDQFVRQSYAEDNSEGIARVTGPIIFLGSAVVAVLAFVFQKDAYAALSIFAAILAIASPVTAAVVGSLPLHKAYRVLAKSGAALTGYQAVERFADTNVVLADACELFTSDEVLLHNIKPFSKTRIDEAILDASSVLCMSNGAIKNIFLRIIQGNTRMLKPVENLVYEDAMGISAWVDGKRVLIGNSDLMRHHGIDTPSKDYESKYRTEERDILYLANSGELTAMFVISYVDNGEVADVLHKLERKGISVVVKSVDPNLTAAKIARIYELPEEMIRILPAKLHMEFESLVGQVQKRDSGLIIHSGTFGGFAQAIGAASSVKLATNIGLIVQIVGMILGYALITFFSFMGSMEQASLLTVLAYQLIWGAVVWLFTGLRRI